jgi:hypothetical protein
VSRKSPVTPAAADPYASQRPPAYHALVALPQFLLVDDSYSDVQTFIALIKRIGLVNRVSPVASLADARGLLTSAQPATLPVVVFSGGAVCDGDGGDLFAWMEEQDPPLCEIPTVSLAKPLEMYAVISELKALSLPERARIDTMTLTVRVELWPHGTVFD